MKIFILGVGKSGTTALVYKVAGGLPNCQAFSGGPPGKYVGDYENAVYKHTYEESDALSMAQRTPRQQKTISDPSESSVKKGAGSRIGFVL
jgi:hypothetical protein